MQIYKYKRFHQWARHEGIEDCTLKKVVKELTNGLNDANLGGGLYKKRIARDGQGKRGGYRTLIAFKEDLRCIFIFGFAKNESSNIGLKETEILKKLAKDYLDANNAGIENLISIGELIEVK